MKTRPDLEKQFTDDRHSMKNLTVAARLGIGFSIVIALLMAVAVIGISRLALLDDNTQAIEKQVEMMALSNDILHKTNLIAISLRSMMLAEDRQDIQKQKSVVLDNRAVILKDVERLWPLVTDAEARRILERAKAERGRYIEGQDRLISLIEGSGAEESRRFLNTELRPVLLRYQGALEEFNRYQNARVVEAGHLADAHYHNARTLSLIVVALALAISVVLALWVIRSVTGPLGGEPSAAREVIERIAGGDLTGTIPLRAGDEKSLMAATHRMQANLRRMLGELRDNADGVAAAAQEMASTASQVAAATSRQAEAASSMAAAVEEMTVSIGHVSDSAREAHAVTTETGELSQQGNRAIDETVTEIQRISSTVGEASQAIRQMGESSERISSIVSVIKEVAEQTNLLALNAAIEAARAGEQGRGFAVVADEVRKLAERTTKATAEIADMVVAVQTRAHQAVSTMDQTVERVEGGVTMARRSSDAILRINEGAERVIGTVTDISSALREQSTVSNDIAGNVESIAQMSEENSAAVHSAADTARRLEQLAAETRQAVARFRI
ncbi:MAG: methyl-accepting chemotaxis protein [Azospira sp.]|jgi:methyl-accepting chemotaxis protein|nr:methyl-accepting chemotaxis protein [Azospira sp.]